MLKKTRKRRINFTKKRETGIEIVNEHQKRDDAIWFVDVHILFPKTVVDADGNFIGLDGLKNDLRSVENVTVVNVLDSVFEEDKVYSEIQIKFNLRLSQKTATEYAHKVLKKNIEKMFDLERSLYGSMPKLLKIGQPYVEEKKMNAPQK